MNRLLSHIRTNVVAYVALFVALGGSSYAAFSLPPGSVGVRELKNHSITPVKFDQRSIAGSVRYWAKISSAGRVIAARPQVRLRRVLQAPPLSRVERARGPGCPADP